MNQNKKGFTLVEIMIVVVIIGLLAAMAVPAFQRVRESSQVSAVENNLRQLSSAAAQYFMENPSQTTVVTANLADLGYLQYDTSDPEFQVADETYTDPITRDTTAAITSTSTNVPALNGLSIPFNP